MADLDAMEARIEALEERVQEDRGMYETAMELLGEARAERDALRARLHQEVGAGLEVEHDRYPLDDPAPLCPHCFRRACPWLNAFSNGDDPPESDRCPVMAHRGVLPTAAVRYLRAKLAAHERGAEYFRTAPVAIDPWTCPKCAGGSFFIERGFRRCSSCGHPGQ